MRLLHLLFMGSALLGLGLGARAQVQGNATTPVRIATNVERTYFPPAEALLRKAYASMGLQVEYVAWPLPRSFAELKLGRLDAAAMRVDAFFEQAPFMRKVDVPLVSFSIFAYGRPPCPASLSLDELAQRRVSYQRGTSAVEALIPEAARVPAHTPSDAFLNVSSGVADFALTLTTPWMAEVPIDTAKGTLCRVATPLTRMTLYHAVHESHADWVAPLEQALRRLRDSGEIQQAWADYEREFTKHRSPRLQAQPGRSLVLNPATPGSAPAPTPQ